MTRSTQMLTRPHPRTGEALPVIGLGTWQTFDVGPSAAERAPIGEVLRTFAAAGGRVIDTSPMYGRAEQVSGDMVAETGRQRAGGLRAHADRGGAAQDY